MKPITFAEQMLRCQQCGLVHDCTRYADYVHSSRPPEHVMFECPLFDPIPCYPIPKEIVTQLAAEGVTCVDCCHCAASSEWDRLVCGEGGPVSLDGLCDKFTLRYDELADYGIQKEDIRDSQLSTESR